ncbi:H-NS histone family protein [Acinetobacter qingfengensis]|uniref:DNA-binding protein n=1 Tax=Acinetobacter qingfengensis TaxID=1262585 RepID=A0A1E7RDF7_9GAMM|nr:H-NS histone family protein [Acinetobacter qingfengensis]KAA8732348.1 H-NS histone family protein [Acinetobacter qingfengensis]OEY97257.1 DNA-binding protein [Acinetobacter qingfengensis]
MSTNIENLDINQLQELTQKAQELIELKKREKVDDAYQQLLTIAEDVGLSLQELIEYGQQSHKPTTKRSVAPRYRNPADVNQTWTGRGKQPRWVVEALNSGKTLEDLLI